MSLAQLRPHLHTLPEHPDWIPYRTSYYREAWGFCLAHRQLEQMPEDEYEVCIDSSLQDGHLTYGEYLVKGASSQEVLVSCHACGRLTDDVIDKALQARARLVVLPCCHATGKCDLGGLGGWIDPALAIDVTRAARLSAAGYQVHTQHIPAQITPKNRLLLGDPKDEPSRLRDCARAEAG